jgi:hypothetical protein
MKACAVAALVWALFSLPAFAQEPKVRASLATPTPGGAWVGQRVTLVVELLAPGFFAGAAAFDLPDPRGVLLVPPSDHPTISSETIDGTSYTVQRHELSVFARRAGDTAIPAFTVRFSFKRQPLDKESVAATVKTEPLPFTAKVPPGAEKLGSIISARQLTAVETWQPEPGPAKAGDAFTRTVTFAAPDVPAMAFPPFPSGAIDGLGVYPKAPEVLDHNERGALRGERREVITYLCQRPGQFTIPAVRFTWFDLGAQKLQTIEFPARTFDVAPNPALASADNAAIPALGPDRRALLITLVAALALVAVAILLWRSRQTWLPLLRVFRPVHLAPLNPQPSNPKRP